MDPHNSALINHQESFQRDDDDALVKVPSAIVVPRKRSSKNYITNPLLDHIGRVKEDLDFESEDRYSNEYLDEGEDDREESYSPSETGDFESSLELKISDIHIDDWENMEPGHSSEIKRIYLETMQDLNNFINLNMVTEKRIRMGKPVFIHLPYKPFEQAIHYNFDATSEPVYATEFSTQSPDLPVRLNIFDEGPGAYSPLSVICLMRHILRMHGSRVAIIEQEKTMWKQITFAEYYNTSVRVARSFIKIGLSIHHGVVIAAPNSSKWMIINMATIFAGGITAGVYADGPISYIVSALKNSRANILVVENNKDLVKILKFISSQNIYLPSLRAVILLEDQIQPIVTPIFQYEWYELLKVCGLVHERELAQRTKSIAVNKCCYINYTSGLGGKFKGTMSCHDNLTWTARMLVEVYNLEVAKEVFIAAIPFPHILAQITSIYLPLMLASPIYIAKDQDIKDNLLQYLQEVQPTAIFAFTHFWTKAMEDIEKSGFLTSKFAKCGNFIVKNTAIKEMRTTCNLTINRSCVLRFLDRFNMNILKKRIGLINCKIACSGGDVLSSEIREFFLGLNVLLCNIYCMSETSGPAILTTPECFSLESSGKVLPGCVLKLYDKKRNGLGQLCLKGRNSFMGYIGSRSSTSQSFTKDDWIKSDDIFKTTRDGHAIFIEKLYETLELGSGEVIYLKPIEERIKYELPGVHYACIIGYKQAYLTLLLTFQCVLNIRTQVPTDDLSPETVEWLHQLGIEAFTMNDVLSGDRTMLVEGVDAAIQKINAELPQSQNIRKWAFVPQDFSLVGHELDENMNMKRFHIMKKYSDLIGILYFGDLTV